MSGEFTSWASVLADAKDALARRDPENWFLASYENRKEVRFAYSNFENFHRFIEWLEFKAAEEAAGYAPGAIVDGICGL